MKINLLDVNSRLFLLKSKLGIPPDLPHVVTVQLWTSRGKRELSYRVSIFTTNNICQIGQGASIQEALVDIESRLKPKERDVSDESDLEVVF